VSGGAGAKQEPLKDGGLVSDSSIVALCVDFLAALNEWDSSSPLISVSIAFVFHFVESLSLTLVDFRTRSLSSAEKATG
jgi:hypothetical protein